MTEMPSSPEPKRKKAPKVKTQPRRKQQKPPAANRQDAPQPSVVRPLRRLSDGPSPAEPPAQNPFDLRAVAQRFTDGTTTTSEAARPPRSRSVVRDFVPPPPAGSEEPEPPAEPAPAPEPIEPAEPAPAPEPIEPAEPPGRPPEPPDPPGPPALPSGETGSSDVERLRLGSIRYDAASYTGVARRMNQDGYLTPVGNYLPDQHPRGDGTLRERLSPDEQRQQAEHIASVLQTLSIPDIPLSADEVLNVNTRLEELINQGYLKGAALVADGVGGYASGELASSIGLVVVTDYINKHVQTESDTTRLLQNALIKADRVIGTYNTPERQEKDENIATTLAVTLTDRTGETFGASVGDTRVYERNITTGQTRLRITDGRLWQALIADGSTFLPSEYFTHPDKRYARTALDNGALTIDQISTFRTTLTNDKQLILTTDGAWELGSARDGRFDEIDRKFADNIGRLGMSREEAARIAYGEFFQLVNCENKLGPLSAEYLTRPDIQNMSRDNTTALIYEQIEKAAAADPRRPRRPDSGPTAVALEIPDPETQPDQYEEYFVNQINGLPSPGDPPSRPPRPTEVVIEYPRNPDRIRHILSRVGIAPDEIIASMEGAHEPFALVLTRTGPDTVSGKFETATELADEVTRKIDSGAHWGLWKHNRELLTAVLNKLGIDPLTIQLKLDELAMAQAAHPELGLGLGFQRDATGQMLMDLAQKAEAPQPAPTGELQPFEIAEGTDLRLIDDVEENDLILNEEGEVYRITEINEAERILSVTSYDGTNDEEIPLGQFQQWGLLTNEDDEPTGLINHIRSVLPPDAANQAVEQLTTFIEAIRPYDTDAPQASQLFLDVLTMARLHPEEIPGSAEEISQMLEELQEGADSPPEEEIILLTNLYTNLPRLLPASPAIPRPAPAAD